ncbi:MAG: hypothetical protein KBG80_04040 [Breznakibacter sp.]|nr:hypothetical protein [Breznakibacter sp.]
MSEQKTPREAPTSSKTSNAQRGKHKLRHKQAKRSAGSTNFVKSKQNAARVAPTSSKESKPQRGKHQWTHIDVEKNITLVEICHENCLAHHGLKSVATTRAEPMALPKSINPTAVI